MNTVTPVSLCLMIINTVVFLLYFTKNITTLPCKKDFQTSFISNFVHVDNIHFMSNLYGIYSLSRVENRIGTFEFSILIVFSLLLNTFIENYVFTSVKCSIGFSGVLYSCFAFEMIITEKIDYYLLLSLVISVFTPYFQKYSKISVLGHFCGLISGIIFGFLYKAMVGTKTNDISDSKNMISLLKYNKFV